jgi:hypothetical protein
MSSAVATSENKKRKVLEVTLSPNTACLVDELKLIQLHNDLLKAENNILKQDLRKVKEFLNLTCHYPFNRLNKLIREDLRPNFLYASLGENESYEDFAKREPLAVQVFDDFVDQIEDCQSDFDSYIDDVLDIVKKYDTDEAEVKLLQGWSFHMNEATENSYVLYPNHFQRVVMNKSVVSYRDDSDISHEVPVSWNIFQKEIERPVFFCAKYKGWIVSLRLYEKLLELGAKEKN